MTKNFYTYLHCRPNGEPFYVGKGYGQRHRKILSGRNRHHRNVVEKYGKENILIYLFDCVSEQEAFTDEIQQISQLRSEGYSLTNVCNGGEGISGMKMSPETIAKRSAKNRWSKRSIETRARMSLAQMGKKPSMETRAKLSALNTGKTHSVESRRKMGIASIGNKFALGYKHTAEAIAKISAASKKMKWTKERCKNISIGLIKYNASKGL